jgi:hypothetical protein
MASEESALVEFFRLLGHKIIHSESSWWYEVQPKVLLPLPYYRLIDPTEEEIRSLFQKHRLRVVRYPAPLNSYGFLSNITVNKKKDYDLKDLHQKARNQTRRGLENCEVRPVDFDELATIALPLNESTALRQGRQSQYADPEYWKRYCGAAKQVKGITAWGSFVKGQLASFLISAEAGCDWREWIVNHSLTDLLSKYPNNALAFTAAQHFFQNEGCQGICYGLGSLEEVPLLDHFKSRMGWTVVDIKQRLVFSRDLRAAFSLCRDPFLRLLNLAFPRNYHIRKTSAMIRLYRQQTYDISERQKDE